GFARAGEPFFVLTVRPAGGFNGHPKLELKDYSESLPIAVNRKRFRRKYFKSRAVKGFGGSGPDEASAAAGLGVASGQDFRPTPA
ncbi:MAG: hypothetical protein ABW250_13215, partial [Pyrinomonadaceae bacterium]